MFSKDDINKAIEVVKEAIDYIKTSEPNATVEIEILEFTVDSLEAHRDRDEIMAKYREAEQRYERARAAGELKRVGFL
jgi:prefoldin subunit 5